jgi:hypothetical protein
MADEVLLVIAEDESGDMVAGALNLIGSHAIYGRNWGCVAGKEWKGLHFECCYYQVAPRAGGPGGRAAPGEAEAASRGARAGGGRGGPLVDAALRQ